MHLQRHSCVLCLCGFCFLCVSAEDWKVFATLPIPADNLTRVSVKGRQLYAAVSYGAAFVPPFVFKSAEADSLLEQLKAALWTAVNRAVRPFKPFPLFGGFIFNVSREMHRQRKADRRREADTHHS